MITIRIKDDTNTGLRCYLAFDDHTMTPAECKAAEDTWPRIICGFQSLSEKEQNRALRNWASRIRRRGFSVRAIER
jgi:hypothetical protein